MNLHAIALVQASLAQVMQAGETAVTLFDHRLFSLDPALRDLFLATDLNGFEHPAPLSQGRVFFTFLQQCVNGLAAPQTIIPVAKRVGYAQARRGIRPEHYQTAAQALFWTLAQVLGDAFTPAVADAWTEAFYLLAGLMKEAAVGGEPLA
jgi:hemoglobin-like flavoprotein